MIFFVGAPAAADRARFASLTLRKRKASFGIKHRVFAFAGPKSGVACRSDHRRVVRRKGAAREINLDAATRCLGFE